MSPLQVRVLAVLEDNGPEWFIYLDTIAERAEVTRREARIAVRALARKGYARLERLFDDNGHTAGSGYGITRAGERAYEAMEEARSLALVGAGATDAPLSPLEKDDK